jgi:hypothetical protein
MSTIFNNIYDIINKFLPVVVYVMLGAFVAFFLVAVGFAVIKLVFGGQDGVRAARKDIGKMLIGALIALLASALALGAQAALAAVKIEPVTVPDSNAQPIVNTIVSAGNAILALLIALMLAGIVVTVILSALMFLGGDDASKKGKTILTTCLIAIGIMLVAVPTTKFIATTVTNGYHPITLKGGSGS